MSCRNSAENDCISGRRQQMAENQRQRGRSGSVALQIGSTSIATTTLSASTVRARRVRKKSSNDLISAQECDASSHSLRRGSAGNVGAQKAIPISAQKNTLLPEPETFEQKRITDPRVLEYAKGLLSGIPSGTVMDWKKINSRQ